MFHGLFLYSCLDYNFFVLLFSCLLLVLHTMLVFFYFVSHVSFVLLFVQCTNSKCVPYLNIEVIYRPSCSAYVPDQAERKASRLCLKVQSPVIG